MNFSLRVGLGQINPTVGDLDGNADLIYRHVQEAGRRECRIIVFPELALTGYPPEDLLFKPAFIKDNLAKLKQLASRIDGLAAVVGFIDIQNGRRYNAAAWIENKKIKFVYHKICLPNYGVFDENRYFSPGQRPLTVPVAGARIGLTVCEDIWINEKHLRDLRKQKPNLILNISASPFHIGKLTERRVQFRKNLQTLHAPLLYCNMVGGQDELVFDGGSFALDDHGKIVAQGPQFKEGLYTIDVNLKKGKTTLRPSWISAKPLSPIEEIHAALILGVKDYVRKNGFSKVALGVSGGIDSAVVACLAVEALGPDNVICVTMPSQYNLSETRKDAEQLTQNLKARFVEVPIQNLYVNYLKALDSVFQNTPKGLAEENIQSRIRGTLLMAMSNKFNWLILTTGNKSELSTGYCTLYGDTAGGFCVLKDVLKTTVFELARHINANAGYALIPESIINRPPTAELKENQKDEDSLGPYANLDPIISDYVEKNLARHEISRRRPGQDEYVKKIIFMIDRNEYKRRQAPPGIKVTARSFGRDHRMPITNRYKPS